MIFLESLCKISTVVPGIKAVKFLKRQRAEKKHAATCHKSQASPGAGGEDELSRRPRGAAEGLPPPRCSLGSASTEQKHPELPESLIPSLNPFILTDVLLAPAEGQTLRGSPREGPPDSGDGEGAQTGAMVLGSVMEKHSWAAALRCIR